MNKFNINDKVIYEGELYTVVCIDTINGYIIYKIDPIKKDGKEYIVDEDEIELYKSFDDLSKYELLALIKTYSTYVEVCFRMKQKPMNVEDYYNNNVYRRIEKEKKQKELSNKFIKCIKLKDNSKELYDNDYATIKYNTYFK